ATQAESRVRDAAVRRRAGARRAGVHATPLSAATARGHPPPMRASVVGRMLMASGDAQRVWFPEMLDELRRRWSASLTWGEVVRLCEEAMALRTRIRQA